MYFLLFTAEPSEDSPEKGKVGRGYAHIWVQAVNPTEAENTSLTYMKKHHLTPLTLEFCCRSTDVLLRQLGTSESRLFRRAEQYGIALDYIAAAVGDSPGLSSFRPMKS